MWYIIHMKRFLKDIAQGIYDGLQEDEATHDQYSFQEIYDVIQEFVSYVFVGLILSVGAVFGYPYYKTFISLGAVLLLVWAFILYYFLNSKDFAPPGTPRRLFARSGLKSTNCFSFTCGICRRH